MQLHQCITAHDDYKTNKGHMVEDETSSNRRRTAIRSCMLVMHTIEQSEFSIVSHGFPAELQTYDILRNDT